MPVDRDTSQRWKAQDEATRGVAASIQADANATLDRILVEIGELVPSIGFTRARDFVLGQKHARNRAHGGGFHPVEDAERYGKVTRAYIAALDRLDLPDDLATPSNPGPCWAPPPGGFRSDGRSCTRRKGHAGPHSWQVNL